MRTILLIIAILLVLGALPTWPYSADWGYYPSGGLLVVGELPGHPVVGEVVPAGEHAIRVR